MNNIPDRTALIVTTIQEPNDVMFSLAKGASKNGWDFIVIGDMKGPPQFNIDGADFYDLSRQKELEFSFAKICPIGHYARKNIGYLIAMNRGADVIVETDDDNFPRDSFFEQRNRERTVRLGGETGWVNVYRYFHKSNIWPRGFPLRYIQSPVSDLGDPEGFFAPIQQGLADDNPDVDAIYRLVAQLPVTFDHGYDVGLKVGQYCPFNSQNTTIFKEAFPLLYLPSHCSFRMTDIWRSFVALRICHALGWTVAFHGPTVWQKRNDHDLMCDFSDEVDGYLKNEAIVRVLENLNLSTDQSAVGDNLRACYEALTREEFILKDEMVLVDAWLNDLNTIYKISVS